MGWRIFNKKIGGGNSNSGKQHSMHNKEGQTYKETETF